MFPALVMLSGFACKFILSEVEGENLSIGNSFLKWFTSRHYLLFVQSEVKQGIEEHKLFISNTRETSYT
jgi:hypothetical protein